MEGKTCVADSPPNPQWLSRNGTLTSGKGPISPEERERTSFSIRHRSSVESDRLHKSKKIMKTIDRVVDRAHLLLTPNPAQNNEKPLIET